MDAYSILNWTGVAFWLLSAYPDLFLSNTNSEPELKIPYVCFKFMSYLYFLLVLFLEFFGSHAYSELFSADLIFALHGLVITCLEMLFQMINLYDYFSSFTTKSQGIMVGTWLSAMILFVLFATGTVHWDTTVYAIIHLVIFLEITVVIMILCKYIYKIQYITHRSQTKLDNWTLILEGIGSFCWTSGIVYRSYYGSIIFMVDQLAKTSIAYITAVFTLISICRKISWKVRYGSPYGILEIDYR